MTAATFSRDDILRYQGMEEGVQQSLEQGAERATTLAIQNMLELGVPEEKILLKYSREELDRAQEAAAVEI